MVNRDTLNKNQLPTLNSHEVLKMPEEVFDLDEFVKLSQRAKYCAVKRSEKSVKLKLRTPKTLFTLKVNPLDADEVVKKLKCEIREI